jgi:multiple sugar transport system ATP-binding protein
MPEDQIYEKVTRAAEILGITDYLLRKPRALSGGQRQRVAIGRAMVRDSKVFLMDEPLSNLDAKLRNQMRAEIILLRQKLDTTFIYVTHDQTEAMTLGDRIVIMRDGFIQQIGTPQEVFDHPKNLYVAGFIGSPQMNFLDVTIQAENGKLYAILNQDKLEIPAFKHEALTPYIGKTVIMGVRPENFLSFDQLSEGNGLSAKLDFCELLGAETNLYLFIDEQKIIVRIPSTMENPTEEYIKVPVDMDRTHFFDKETEQAICH